MTRAERGWLAGIIDGEGCIFARMKGNVAQVTVNISNNHPRIIERSRRMVEEITGQLPHVIDKAERPCKYFQISAIDAVQKVLECVHPHLEGKKEQALVALEYLKDRPFVKGQRISADDRERHEKVCRTIKLLNARYNVSIKPPVETV